MILRGFERGIDEHDQVADAAEREALTCGGRGHTRLGATQIGGSLVQSLQLILERAGHGLHDNLRAEAVSDRHETEEMLVPIRSVGSFGRLWGACRVRTVLNEQILQPRHELLEVVLADALCRTLASPERGVVEQARERAAAPADIQTDQLEFRQFWLELFAKLQKGVPEPFEVAVAALRRVMPAVHESHDDGIVLCEIAANHVHRLIDLTLVPEPAFVIRLDEVERVVVAIVIRYRLGAPLVVAIIVAVHDGEQSHRNTDKHEVAPGEDSHETPPILPLGMGYVWNYRLCHA